MENWGAIYCVAKQNIFCQQNSITTKDVELNCFKMSIGIIRVVTGSCEKNCYIVHVSIFSVLVVFEAETAFSVLFK